MIYLEGKATLKITSIMVMGLICNIFLLLSYTYHLSQYHSIKAYEKATVLTVGAASNQYVNDSCSVMLNGPNTLSTFTVPVQKPSMAQSSCNAKANAVNEYVFVRWLGSNGTANGQFRNPEDVGIDYSGNVYVTSDDRIQKFSNYGNF